MVIQREDLIMQGIPREEFRSRIEKLREIMDREKTEIFLIYGDEYRREHLRYVSNHWPACDKGLLAVGLEGEPILLVAPETEGLAKEMSVWRDIRILREMEMAYVPEQIEYAAASRYTKLRDVILELSKGKTPKKIKLCGMDAMSVITYEAIKSAIPEAKVESGDEIIYRMRLIKSPAEIEMLKKAGEICDISYKAVLDADIVGLTERQAAAIGEKAARDAGAEVVVFSIFASGEERTNTIIPRAAEKIIQKGDMIMYALAVQYEGYIASDEWPFVAGGEPTPEQLNLIKHVIKAEDIGVKNLKAGVVAGDVVKKIRKYFSDNGLEKYDLYPPIHGNGLAEAESPYPDEHTTYKFLSGMGVNFDVSIFGVPGIGSNRVEEGFVIGEDNNIVLSKLINRLREDFLSKS